MNISVSQQEGEIFGHMCRMTGTSKEILVSICSFPVQIQNKFSILDGTVTPGTGFLHNQCWKVDQLEKCFIPLEISTPLSHGKSIDAIKMGSNESKLCHQFQIIRCCYHGGCIFSWGIQWRGSS